MQVDRPSYKYSESDAPRPGLSTSADVKNMRQTQMSRTVGGVCLGLAAALLVLSGVVRAANVGAAWDNGSTVITSTSCSASFSGKVAPSPHTVVRNDVAFFYLNASWSDTRAVQSPSATHVFHLKIQWAVSLQSNEWYNVTTTGSASGSHQLVRSLTIDFAYTVDVTWEASVSSGATCTSGIAQDTATVVFQF